MFAVCASLPIPRKEVKLSYGRGQEDQNPHDTTNVFGRGTVRLGIDNGGR